MDATSAHGAVCRPDYRGRARRLPRARNEPSARLVLPAVGLCGRATPQSGRRSIAEYMSITVGGLTAPRAASAYMAPPQAQAASNGYIAFYPSRVESCFVGTERAVAQQGDFYRGWITPSIRGRFKGGPGGAN